MLQPVYNRQAKKNMSQLHWRLHASPCWRPSGRPEASWPSPFTPLYTHTHTLWHTYIETYVHMYICTYVHMYICTYIHTYAYIHIYVYTYIHIYMYTYVHIYIYTCIYAYVCIGRRHLDPLLLPRREGKVLQVDILKCGCPSVSWFPSVFTM